MSNSKKCDICEKMKQYWINCDCASCIATKQETIIKKYKSRSVNDIIQFVDEKTEEVVGRCVLPTKHEAFELSKAYNEKYFK